jgi:hypothetical protein
MTLCCKVCTVDAIGKNKRIKLIRQNVGLREWRQHLNAQLSERPWREIGGMAALQVATAADRLDFQRLRIIAVFVLASLAAAVGACEKLWAGQDAELNCAANLAMGAALHKLEPPIETDEYGVSLGADLRPTLCALPYSHAYTSGHLSGRLFAEVRRELFNFHYARIFNFSVGDLFNRSLRNPSAFRYSVPLPFGALQLIKNVFEHGI